MGNRAVLEFKDQSNQPNIYLHWNGGRASVEAFLNGGHIRIRNLKHVNKSRACK